MAEEPDIIDRIVNVAHIASKAAEEAIKTGDRTELDHQLQKLKSLGENS
jgi:hypothetical protein